MRRRARRRASRFCPAMTNKESLRGTKGKPTPLVVPAKAGTTHSIPLAVGLRAAASLIAVRVQRRNHSRDRRHREVLGLQSPRRIDRRQRTGEGQEQGKIRDVKLFAVEREGKA